MATKQEILVLQTQQKNLFEVRAAALQAAATLLAGGGNSSTRVIDIARTFEDYLRGGSNEPV